MTNKDLIASFFGQQNVLTCMRPVAQKYGIIEGIFISQLIYWSDRARMADGWFAKSYEELGEETAITKKQSMRCRSFFEQKGIIETKVKKFNGTPTVHYRVKIDIFIDDLTGESDQKEYPEVPKGNFGKCQKGTLESYHRDLSSITKPTTEPTAKNTTPPSAGIFQTSPDSADMPTVSYTETPFALWCRLHRESGLGGYNGKPTPLQLVDLPDERKCELIERWFQGRASKPEFFPARLEAFAKGFSRVADDSKYNNPYENKGGWNL